METTFSSARRSEPALRLVVDASGGDAECDRSGLDSLGHFLSATGRHPNLTHDDEVVLARRRV
jgi:hypothetical protein